MKQHVIALLLVMLLFGCSGNSDPTNKPKVEGFIVQVNENSIIVASNISRTDAKTKTWEELSEKYRDKLEVYTLNDGRFFSSLSNYKKGEKVKVWGNGGALESDPPQYELEKIERVGD
ncbi:DUF3221 domain-containing protein [Pontibacillus salicampi]|uniref:DUF3221 domain-containing protein n=1 Tax=Pontibacillus salicampi TaxID=1449801 RepID=A0ABV6LKV5_9BACI